MECGENKIGQSQLWPSTRHFETREMVILRDGILQTNMVT